LETLRKLKWEVTKHPAHSPGLSPSDFHVSGPLKGSLGGRKCIVTRRVSGYARNQMLSVMMTGRWGKCVEWQDDYVEKLCILFL
jgi:hypothetical protein